MKVHYLEFVSTELEAQIHSLEKLHKVSFSAPVAELGNAKIAEISDGSIIGVRSPMHDAEAPCVRPYFLTADINTAMKQLEEDGTEIALPPTEIPGRGTFAIHVQGGLQLGLWQLSGE